MKIACVNYEPVSLYRDQGWSKERLRLYYNPSEVAQRVRIFTYNDRDWEIASDVGVSGFCSFRELVRECEAFHPDVIRCYEAFRPFCDYALAIGARLKVPSYLSLHDGRLRYHQRLARFDVITAYTPTVARNAAQALNRSVEVQLNGIDSQLFCPKTPSFIDERVAHAKYRIFTVGRNDPVKNMDTAIKATQLLSERIGSVAHVIAGPGTEHIAFDGVHLGLGSLGGSMIVEYLNWCSCFLQVQLVSDLGIAACEALVVGRPVIVTGDVYGNAETHIDAQKGTLIPIEKVRDANYIANELQRCLETSYDFSKIRNWAIQVYDAEHLREKEAERYRRLISARGETNRSRYLIWDTFMWSLYGVIAMETLRQKCRNKMK